MYIYIYVYMLVISYKIYYIPIISHISMIHVTILPFISHGKSACAIPALPRLVACW